MTVGCGAAFPGSDTPGSLHGHPSPSESSISFSASVAWVFMYFKACREVGKSAQDTVADSGFFPTAFPTAFSMSSFSPWCGAVLDCPHPQKATRTTNTRTPVKALRPSQGDCVISIMPSGQWKSLPGRAGPEGGRA